MKKDPSADLPAFISPLTHDQHAQLGRMAVLWGQVDMILDNLLDLALNITPAQRMTLIGEKPIGAKLDILSKHLSGLTHPQGQKLARRFWDLANQTKTQRNRCFHGVWGWWASPSKKVIPAASHFKAKENPVKVGDLAAIERKLCQTSRAGIEALRLIQDWKTDLRGSNRLFHGKSPSPPWLEEWCEQHPVDDRSLDRRHKRGQLPYLAEPV